MTDEIKNELNLDSTLGLLRIMSLFTNPAQQTGTEDDSNSYFAVSEMQILSPIELNTIFRNSFLARKIIEKYPEEAKTLGYTLEGTKGEVVEDNNQLLIETVYEGQIWARLYGLVFMIYNYDKTLPNEPLKPGIDKLTGYSTEFELRVEGDYFVKSDEVKYHKSKVHLFYGRKTYIPFASPYDKNYADSIYQSLAITLRNYVSSNETVRKILSNISYLLLGIKNLGNMTKTEKGQSEVYMRLASLRANRSVNRVIAYDKENEALSYITQATAGITDLVSAIKEIFIAESDYPPEQLFEERIGQSLGSGISNQLIARFLWAKRCHSYAIRECLPHYKEFFDRNFPNNNYNVKIPFKLEFSQQEQAELEMNASTRTKNLVESGVITPEEARSGYKNDEFDLNIVLDDATFKKMQELSIKAKEQSINQPPNDTRQRNNNTNNSTGANNDSVYIPSDNLWDDLANVSQQDLAEVMTEALTDATKENQ